MRTRFWDILFGVSTVLGVLCVPTLAGASIDDTYQLQVPPSEARSSLDGLLTNLKIRAEQGGALDPQATAYAIRLIRSYRSSAVSNTQAIKDAPYLGLILGERAGEIYPVEYDKNWKEQYDKFVVHVQLESLFDGLMKGILNHSLPPSMDKTAKEIGQCLAKKVLKGRGEKCVLDSSESLAVPDKATQAIHKVACELPLPTPCDTRKLIYNAAKPQLIEARKDPAVRKTIEEEFKKVFPIEFRKEFLEEINDRAADFPKLVSQKFRGNPDTFWSVNTPLTEGDDGAPTLIKLRQLATSLRADLGVATLLVQSGSPDERGMAAPLFYSVANRLLMLTGGKQAKWSGSEFVIAAGNQFDPKKPKLPPVFATHLFGGWGVGKASLGPSFSAWDWEAYDPTRAINPSPLRLFPSEWMIHPDTGKPQFVSGAEYTENLGDLAGLLEALGEFLRVTRPEAPFAPFFGSGDQLVKIIEPTSPILFPREGRMLAVGIIAGIMKNLVAPAVGHLEMTHPGDPGAGLGIGFHETIHLNGRDARAPSLSGIARLLVATADLRKVMNGDPDVPHALQDLAPQLDQAIQVGALTLSAKGQATDGGFGERLGEPQVAHRTLMTQVDSTLALTRAYERSQILVLRIALRQAWMFMDRYWSVGSIPRLQEEQGSSWVQPSQLWSVVNLWEQTQPLVKSRAIPEIDWAPWGARMELLKRRLLEQLRQPQGPKPFRG